MVTTTNFFYKGDGNMSNLEKSTSIYVDFKNMLFDVDKYVLETIYKTMQNRKEFSSLFRILKETGGGMDDIPYLIKEKNYKNPLIELLIMNKSEPVAERDVFLPAQFYYNYIVNDLENENLDVELQPTNLSATLRVLLKNEYLEKIFVYMDVARPELCDAIYNFFTGSTKVFICTGDRKDLFKDFSFDTYIFEDVQDVVSLMDIDPDTPKHVLIPEFKYNFNTDGSIKMDIPKGLSEHMSVNSIKLPI